MIKLAVAIADTQALPSAFVVFRGFEESIRKAGKLGYDGVELALKHAGEVNRQTLTRALETANLTVSCVSTGQVYADLGLSFSDPDRRKREEFYTVFAGLIDVAADFGQKINIGRSRGQIGASTPEETEQRFLDMAWRLCDYAASKGVTLILEPVNRYEIDFINTVSEGVNLMQKVNRPNMKLMPDVFHMNIEDVSIGGELARNIKYIDYIHFADSNRLAPGEGHTDFLDIFDQLQSVHYDGWVSIEILDKPDPDTAAQQSIEYLRPLIDAYNGGA